MNPVIRSAQYLIYATQSPKTCHLITDPKSVFYFYQLIVLAIEFTAFYPLWKYSTVELKSDQYHTNARRIGCIGIHWNDNGDGGKTWGHVALSFEQEIHTKNLETVKGDKLIIR